MFSGIGARIRSVWRGVRRRNDLEADMLAEFQHHIELRARDLERAGMSSTEAMRRARLEFGHVETHRESARVSRGLRWFDELGFSWLDVKLGIRMIRKYPGLTAVSVIGMAVAIAIGAGFFGMIQAQLNPTLPLPGGERMVALELATDEPGDPERRALHDFALWREELTSVTAVGAFRHARRNAETPAGTRLVHVVQMSAAGFRVTDVPPLMGRPLLDEDEEPGAPAVVVIGEQEWRQHFDSDPDVIGATIRLGGRMHTVVGVMPAAFRLPVNDGWWVPLRLNPADYEVGGGPEIQIFGRLAAGATMERARAELATLGARMAAEYPDTHARLRPQALPYASTLLHVDSPSVAVALRLAQAGISLLLVLVAANVGTLVYARTATRISEITVRSALGASRRRIIVQLFVEAFLVSAIAAAIGLGIAVVALDQIHAFLQRTLGDVLPFWFRLDLSRSVILYVVALALLGGIIVGVLPGLQATGRRVQSGLQRLAGRGSQLRLGHTWTALIVAQVAIAVAILPFAVYISSRSVERGIADPAYPAGEVLFGRLSMERDEAPPEAVAATWDSVWDARFAERGDALLRRLAAEPGVTGVAFVQRPFESGFYERFEIEDGPTLTLLVNGVDVDAFEVMGVPVVDGRSFDAADARGEPRTTIVRRELASMVGGPLLGRRIRTVRGEGGDGPIERGPWLEVVGIVPDFGVEEDFEPQPPRIYTPLTLARAGDVELILRTRGGAPPALRQRLVEIASSVDPLLQLDAVRTAVEHHRTLREAILALAAVVVAISVSVLLLSAAGIYAMMSFTVARRRREIGIRSALGAAPRRLLAGIFARAAAQLGAGVLIGLAFAGAIGYVMLGGGPSLPDALAFGPAVAAIIAAVGFFAALGPARRALAVQPTECLREE